MSADTRHAVEELLGVALPPSVGEVRFERHCPGGDLSFFVAFVSLEMPAAEASLLVSQLGMSPRGAGGETDFFLSSGWNVFPEARPPWFAPGELTERAVARRFGVDGWMVADIADGALLMLATDTGRVP
jgi:hypothetical protein